MSAKRPAGDNRDAWRAFWTTQGMPWRTEPEIDEARQQFLAGRRAVTLDFERDIYPFRDENGSIKLARADVEWLLATHEDQGVLGPAGEGFAEVAKHPRRGLDLRGANLSGADLSGLPLERMWAGYLPDTWTAHLGGPTDLGTGRPWRSFSSAAPFWGAAQFDGATLREARLRHAQLRGVSLRQANLQGAHLVYAVLREADLREANLRAAWCQSAIFSHALLARANLQRAHLEQADLAGVFLRGADLGGAHLRGASLARASCEDANLSGADLRETNLRGAFFLRANLRGANLTGARMQGANLEDADLKGTLGIPRRPKQT